jgi:hypothetical protein
LSAFDRRLSAHPAEIPRLDRPGNPRRKPSYPLIHARGRLAHLAGSRLTTDPGASCLQVVRLLRQQPHQASRADPALRSRSQNGSGNCRLTVQRPPEQGALECVDLAALLERPAKSLDHLVATVTAPPLTQPLAALATTSC